MNEDRREEQLSGDAERLMAEVARLRAENATLRAECDRRAVLLASLIYPVDWAAVCSVLGIPAAHGPIEGAEQAQVQIRPRADVGLGILRRLRRDEQ